MVSPLICRDLHSRNIYPTHVNYHLNELQWPLREAVSASCGSIGEILVKKYLHRYSQKQMLSAGIDTRKTSGFHHQGGYNDKNLTTTVVMPPEAKCGTGEKRACVLEKCD